MAQVLGVTADELAAVEASREAPVPDLFFDRALATSASWRGRMRSERSRLATTKPVGPAPPRSACVPADPLPIEQCSAYAAFAQPGSSSSQGL
jgi:hypothetical protein